MCKVNEKGLFKKYFRGIYPEQLQLKNENVSRTKTSFLDIVLEIIVNKILNKIFDKCDSLLFENVCMPLLNNNIPSKNFYSSIGSEILRLVRSTSDRLTFIMLINKLLDIMSKQRSRKMDIKILLKKFFGRHFEVFSKFEVTAKGFHILLKL